MTEGADRRLSAPSALRNREAILAVLRRHISSTGAVLEIASGTGEHVLHFAQALPDYVFQPSDPDADRRASIDCWCAGMANVRPAIDLDTTQPWPDLAIVASVAAILCINMVHIAPWVATEGLMAGAATHLAPGGCLLLYGPYRRNAAHTALSNADFDADLRQRNPQWGVRDLEAVQELALAAGLSEGEVVEMPSHNLCVLFHQPA